MSKKKAIIPVKIFRTAILTITCSSNNTLMFLQYSSTGGASVTAGMVGLKAAKRSTFFAAQQVLLTVIKILKERKIKSIFIFFKGLGRGRRAIIKGFKKKNIKILRIFDKTCIAHNGCRPSKKRRL